MPDTEKMKLIQRLGNDIDDGYIDSYASAIEKYKGSCNEVWFATEYGFPPLEKHRETAARIRTQAQKFRSIGVEISLQLSNSIGHGEYMSSRDCSGLLFEGSGAEKLVGHDGTVAGHCFCWRGENFKKYLLEELRIYASAVKPSCIWIDDDFRACNHAPVDFGCFCDDCIKKFNKKHSYSFDRESLVEEFLHGDINVRENYIEFIREGLHDLMYETGKTVRSASPSTALGLQYAAYGAYTGYGYDFIFDAMLESTGVPPRSRLGGGAYNDHDPDEIIDKALFTNWANAMLPSYVTSKCPEIENLPFVAFGKSPSGTAFEASCYFANGNTDMSFSMIMHLSESMEWHEKELRLFSEQYGYWERLSECNRASHQSGLHYFMSKEAHKRRLPDDATMADIRKECYDGAKMLIYDAVPISYDREATDDVILLHPENAAIASDAEIEYLLGRNVITDGETIELLGKRGFELGITAIKLSDSDVLKINERLADNKANPNGFEKYTSSFFTKGRNNIYRLETSGTDIELLGSYEKTHKSAMLEDESIVGSAAELILRTKEGGRWAVLGYAPWKGVISLNKRDQILNIADVIGEKRLPARLATPLRAVLLPRKDENGKTVAVSIINCTIGKSDELELVVRDPLGEDISFMSQYSGEARPSFTKRGDELVIKLPSIEPWSVGTVFFASEK